MKKCTCGEKPMVRGNGTSWSVMCVCKNGLFGIGHSRHEAKRMWNRGVRMRRRIGEG